jgi:hypothetical protein
MISTSTTETIPFTPEWLRDRPNPPVFHLRAGGVIERGRMEAELAGEHDAGRVYSFELHQAAVAGVSVLLEGDPGLDEVLGAIEAETQIKDPTTDKLPDEQVRLLVDVRKVLVAHWPDYRDLVARRARRGEIAPVVALKRFCAGWDSVTGEDGKPVPFARGRDGMVTEAALSRLQSIELLSAGNRAYALQFSTGEEGNSERPVSSETGPQTSASDDTSTADGSSPESVG